MSSPEQINPLSEQSGELPKVEKKESDKFLDAAELIKKQHPEVAEFLINHAKFLKLREIDEKNDPVDRLTTQIDKITVAMKEKGLESDATIVEKIKERFNCYAETLRGRREKLEDKSGRKVPLEHLQLSSSRVAPRIPITHQIGESGGYTYGPEGFQGFSFSDEYIKTNEKAVEKLKEESNEAINFSFSKQGEKEFLRAMGIFGEKDELVDMPEIYQKITGKKIDAAKYEISLPTNIDGIELHLAYDHRRAYDGKREKQIAFEFSKEFMGKILAKK